MIQLDVSNNGELKAMELFHRRCKDIGINGLNHTAFLEKIKEMSRPCVFEFSYKQPREKIFIGKKILIADIRRNPFVKKDFRPDDLIELGEEQGFKYHKYEYLGNPFFKRHIKEKDPKNAKREYQAYILTSPDAKNQFQELFQQLNHHQIVFIMCYCPVEKPKNKHDPGECHRFWLAELLKKQKRVSLKKNRIIASKTEIQETKTEVLEV